MSSLNHCIKFELDVKDENIVFKDYFYKSIKLQKHKIYEAELIQPAVLFAAPWISYTMNIWLPTFTIQQLMQVCLSLSD